MDNIKQQRQWMKSNFVEADDMESDQQLKLPQPPLQKPYDENGEKIDLPKVNENILTNINIFDIFKDRISHRSFSSECISLEELSFLLWATQGVKMVKGDNYATLRTVPSAGARHPFETYIVVNRVEGLKSGVYRYLPLTHQLLYIFEGENLEERLSDLTLGQKFVGKSAVTFIWSVIPYRGEWRYNIVAHKTMILDAGHVCQNLYLACEAIGCGTCAIAAYDQKEFDRFLDLDGEDEFVIYLAPVGKIS
ncbi:SagB/ThcOx family dehydrogenase [Clostridium sp. CF012]|uniref:SagB/ThcOx family dehydrogenase n=1 Tax=Clostridium sp. CF012 TaxID=2843319 RepID=UPI001C0E6DD6|nr:SagB/ThcOx family dehydrogenase [Clostridium sp. CF012]MBU3144687.1 SagB/ThcOx family dehydrogenase [Clostridium sp. CF012]